jgi:predicted DCC family thiol-disulfide oxidoreductase YuxK
MNASPAADRAIVLYDGDCAFCRRSIRILRALDWFGRLAFQSAREIDRLPATDPPLDPAKLIEEMHVVPAARDRARAGFSAFRWMAWRMPLTFPVAPFLYLPGVLWLGNRVYRWVARNRFNLVPCHDGACQVPLRKKS